MLTQSWTFLSSSLFESKARPNMVPTWPGYGSKKQTLHRYWPLKTKNSYICRKIGKKTPRQLILEAGAKFIAKIINTQTPPEIYNMLVFPRKFRKNAMIYTKSAPRTKKCRRSTIYSTLAIFNSLHHSLKYNHPKIFKRLIEKRRILEILFD